ncbi:MAG: LysE family transporter [Deltaproteobacteria bacterium]|nr:LysE family transporter [Deltaproteobacteria bacterium]
METVGSLLALGASFGFAAGVSPGPLTTLVLTTSLQRGFASGARVALAPLMTDAPVILLSLLALGSLPASFLRFLSLAGGGFVCYLGLKTLMESQGASLTTTDTEGGPRDLWQGFAVNTLSPHPWLFWVAVGGPILFDAWQKSPLHASAFLLGFFPLIVGCKMSIAWLAARGRRYLKGPWYGRVLAVAGIQLALLGIVLLWQAFETASP